MLRSSYVLVIFFFVSPLFAAEVFKCTRENGMTVYQNFRCGVDWSGSVAATAPQEQETGVPPSAPVQVRTKVVAAQVAAAGKSPGPREDPRIDMTTEEVKASAWGEPIDIVKEEVVEGMNQTWHYGENRSVQFNHMDRVTNIAR